MARTVIHQPKVAWDGARAFVGAAGGPEYSALATEMLGKLGTDWYGELANTRQRLLTASVERDGNEHAIADVEAARWRVRLEDLMRRRPDLIRAVQELTEAVAR
ncbi:hypothetical protein [Actinoplanes sp. NPDC049118]|uniref:hypothetical protein n=1 Tax=Actinoplanes sp. NPDC049118 TaxID=3155769 RepID=UPI0033CF443E